MKTCKICNTEKPFSEFHKHSLLKDGYNNVCKSCRKPLSKKSYDNSSIEYRMWYRARNRARKKHLEFTIEITDIVIPDVCPIFLTKMDVPSLDRINSNEGYTKNNIQVISNRANMLKNNATLSELQAILTHLKACEVK